MKKTPIRTTGLLFSIGMILSFGEAAEEAKSTTSLWKPKEGTSYVENLPKEIIWLKDGAEMVLVPGGQFLFGKRKDRMKLDSFYMDKFPVTNKRYREFIRETGHRVPFLKKEEAKKSNWRGKSYPKGKAKHPVVLVSWSDAMAYCHWAGKTLPAEEQWEKAARGGDGRVYPWGDEFDQDKCNNLFSEIKGTTPVDKYPQGVSPYGCYDMAGNVWEWTRSRMRARPVVRGGSFFDGDAEARSSLRVLSPPDVKCRNMGFRSCWVPNK
ncbi:SUMF1/EgtB/PvdO family nonheme iron enzyme [bacterium]|nr:SUMF1/EgtB/PvdO family nonheme iron enzyme [bacterium]